MFYINPSNEEKNRLIENLNEAIKEAINKGGREPHIVANIARIIPEKINKIEKISGYTVKASSIFVHQTPRVRFDNIYENYNKRYIEIGDLLLISRIIDRGNTYQKALLLQAKITNDLSYIVSDNDSAQHQLYYEWPCFEYISSTPSLNNKIRLLSELDKHSATKFLLLISSELNAYTAVPSIASNQRIANDLKSFTSELCDFFIGKAGESFVVLDYPMYSLMDFISNILKPCEDIGKDSILENFEPFSLLLRLHDEWIDSYNSLKSSNQSLINTWSLIINDLLQVTASRSTSLMNGQRGINTKDILDHFASQSEAPKENFAADDNVGISTLIFTLERKN